eukprot:m.611279 g.611279  ORF g.611279 m.611279 type:complete len:166 (-) comp58140_c0_seq11:2579-3076(-)
MWRSLPTPASWTICFPLLKHRSPSELVTVGTKLEWEAFSPATPFLSIRSCSSTSAETFRGFSNVCRSSSNQLESHRSPCHTPVDSLILAATSNWGGYGLLGALELLSGRDDLLPTVAAAMDDVRVCVQHGAVEGFSGECVEKVDGRTLEEDSMCLAEILNVVRTP